VVTDPNVALVRRILDEGIEVRARLKEQAADIIKVAEVITSALQAGKKVILFGNGGSAADAQHIAAELVGRFRVDRAALPAIALTTNTSLLTAIANDYDFERVFARQVEAIVHEGDVVVGISTSGNSPNVIAGMAAARRRGGVTVALAGSGGRLQEVADYVLAVPSRDTARIQEAHITVGHILCHLVEMAQEPVDGEPSAKG
jgi:D-sedoheptulose 7-phosphate isomerase